MEPVTAKGFVVMDTPGFDPPSVTGMVAGGANLCVFTTEEGKHADLVVWSGPPSAPSCKGRTFKT